MKKSPVLLPVVGCCVLFFSPTLAGAGDLVFGPEAIGRETGIPVAETHYFSVEDDSRLFWLQISNGLAGEHLASSAIILLNGEEVVGPKEFNQQVLGLNRDVHLDIDNELIVEVRGAPGSFITLEIRESDRGTVSFNPEEDLWGALSGELVSIWWAPEDEAYEYIVYRALSKAGPWEEANRIPIPKGIDFPPSQEGEDLCYRIEAVNDAGNTLRQFNPVCFSLSDTEDLGPLTAPKKSEEDTVRLYRPPSIFDAMCLSDDDFTNDSSMSLDQIDSFLSARNSFLRGHIRDVDGALISPAHIIHTAALVNEVSPQVLLTTLQKEHGAVKSPKRLQDNVLRIIMGFDTSNPSTIREQIFDAATQFRLDFNRLASGEPTGGGWQVRNPKQSEDPLTVTPVSSAVAILFSYTPWVGEGWGGRKGIGGNYLFCDIWLEFSFGPDVICELLVDLETFPGDDGELGTQDDVPAPDCGPFGFCFPLGAEYESMGISFYSGTLFQGSLFPGSSSSNHFISSSPPDVVFSEPINGASIDSYSAWTAVLYALDDQDQVLASDVLPNPTPGNFLFGTLSVVSRGAISRLVVLPAGCEIGGLCDEILNLDNLTICED